MKTNLRDFIAEGDADVMSAIVTAMARSGAIVDVTSVAVCLSGGASMRKRKHAAYRVVAADLLIGMTAAGLLIQHGEFGPKREDGGPWFTIAGGAS